MDVITDYHDVYVNLLRRAPIFLFAFIVKRVFRDEGDGASAAKYTESSNQL